MSYKDSAYKGGRVSPEDDKPSRVTYPCFADNCPMPGTMFPEHARQGVCVWHYGVVPNDLPRVTSVLRAWDCVAYEIDHARAVLSGKLASDAAAQNAEFTAAWERLKPLAGTWEAELAPGNLRSSKGVERPWKEGYSDWVRRLERFIGARVVETLSVNQRRAA